MVFVECWLGQLMEIFRLGIVLLMEVLIRLIVKIQTKKSELLLFHGVQLVFGPTPNEGEEDPNLINSGGGFITANPGAASFSSADSFALIRGGHVDATVLGAMQVDENADLANWMVPGKLVAGMGGAMDLLTNARVIIAMIHTQKGAPKILHKCNLPLTAKGKVNMIITEMCVMEFKPEGLTLTELYPEFTVEDVKAATEADFIVSPDLKPMQID